MIARRLHSQEFKEEAVRRAKEPGAVLKQVATELDIVTSVLARWIREKERGHWEHPPYSRRPPTPKNAKPPAVLANSPDPKVSNELERLRQQLALVTEERDLLKKMVTHYLKTQ